MGGGVSFEMLNKLGEAFRVFGKFTGSKNETTAFVDVRDDPGGLPDGIYEVDTSQLSNVLATIDIDFLVEKGVDVPGIDEKKLSAPTSNVVSGDAAMSKIRDSAFKQAELDGNFPLIRNASDVDQVISSQYKGLFEDFKAQNPEFADRFKDADEYWNYIKGGGVDVTTQWVAQEDLNPILQASNKLYAEQVLGVPEDGFIEVYRNAINHKDTQELSAAGYASLDKNMAWDYRSEAGLKNGIDGRYSIKVKPEEVQGLLGYSQARDEFAVVVGPDITSIPGRVTRVGDTEVITVTPYIDDTKTLNRNNGDSPFRFFSIASQYDFQPTKEEFTPGNSWAEYQEMKNIPKGELAAEFNKLFGDGAFREELNAIGGNLPQFSMFKDMWKQLPDGTWGFDPRELEAMRVGYSGDPAKVDFALKMFTAMQSVTGTWFMTPGTGF